MRKSLNRARTKATAVLLALCLCATAWAPNSATSPETPTRPRASSSSSIHLHGSVLIQQGAKAFECYVDVLQPRHRAFVPLAAVLAGSR